MKEFNFKKIFKEVFKNQKDKEKGKEKNTVEEDYKKLDEKREKILNEIKKELKIKEAEHIYTRLVLNLLYEVFQTKDEIINFIEKWGRNRIISIDFYALAKGIFYLKDPALNILHQIKEKIDNDYYDVILGDDASGRIPTIILREIINKRLDKIGKNRITTKFVSGGKGGEYWSEEKTEGLKYVLQKMNLKNKKVLFVSEYIASGSGLSKMFKVFDELGIKGEAAVFVSALSKDYYLREFEIFKKYPLIIGKPSSSNPPEIYGNYFISGVEKVSTDYPVTKKTKNTKQLIINYTRDFIKAFSEKIAKEFWEDEGEKK